MYWFFDIIDTFPERINFVDKQTQKGLIPVHFRQIGSQYADNIAADLDSPGCLCYHQINFFPAPPTCPRAARTIFPKEYAEELTHLTSPAGGNLM
jgi:hypothetical protein